MGGLNNYDLHQGVIEYTDDPLKIGRVKCSIPSMVMHSTTEEKDALPWARPFRMGAYQTFSKPSPGQKVWILSNKSNYNEFWWMPFSESTDISQGFLNEHYNDDPEIFHSREAFVSPISYTWDNQQGYKWTIGEDYIDFFPTREFKLKVNDCNINVTQGNELQLGSDNGGEYEPAVKGLKCEELRGEMAKACNQLAEIALRDAHTQLLKPGFNALAKACTSIDIKCKYCRVN